MSYKIYSFYERLEMPVEAHEFDQTEITIQDKALSPRQLIERLNNGVLTETDIHRNLPNDNDIPLSSLDVYETDEMDLANTKSFLDKVGNQFNDHAKKQRENANKQLDLSLQDGTEIANEDK